VTYTPAGTGAVATNVQDQLRNIQRWSVNVQDAPFYAKGDGVTDDTAAIQAALDASSNVYFPEGVYLISGIVIHKNTCVYGASTEAYSATAGTVIEVDGTVMRPIILEDNSISVSNITVSNPTAVQLECLIGKKDNAPGDVTTRLFNYQLTNIICTGKADHHFFFPYAWQGVLTNCRSEGGEQTVGFRFDTGTSTTLNSCLAYSPLGYGFSFKSFNYSTLNSCGVDAGSRGFYFETDNRGMTMNSIGTEGLTDYSVFI